MCPSVRLSSAAFAAPARVRVQCASVHVCAREIFQFNNLFSIHERRTTNVCDSIYFLLLIFVCVHLELFVWCFTEQMNKASTIYTWDMTYAVCIYDFEYGRYSNRSSFWLHFESVSLSLSLHIYLSPPAASFSIEFECLPLLRESNPMKHTRSYFLPSW